MALPTQHWRMLQPVVVPATGSATTGGIAGIIDALYTMGTATTYADGSARSPGTFASPGTASLPASVGTGSAWTWNYDNTTFVPGVKTGLYAYPPTTTAINQVVAFGGTTSVTGAVWKQLASDTRVVDALYCGIAKNSGTYTSWNNATTPFTSGDFTGFTYVGPAVNTATGYVVFMFECEESVAVFRIPMGGGAVVGAVIGAFVDPLSASTSNAETDGRLYGVTNTGGQATAWNTGWLAAAAGLSDTQLFNGITNASYYHFYTFTPGAGTVVGCSRFGTYSPTSTFISRNGDLPQIPFQCGNAATGGYIGQLRQINITRDSNALIAWETGGTVKGYLVGPSTTSVNDAVVLVY